MPLDISYSFTVTPPAAPPGESLSKAAQAAADKLTSSTFTVLSFEGEERMSSLFRFEIEVFSKETDFPLEELVGLAATFKHTIDKTKHSYVHGVVADIRQERGWYQDVEGKSVVGGAYYRVVLVPQLWKLGLRFRSRVFQNLTIDDLLKEVLQGAGLREKVSYQLNLRDTYEPKQFCVQYRETDLQFIQRTMEETGLYYFFDHTGTSDLLVITDDRREELLLDGTRVETASTASAASLPAPVPYDQTGGLSADAPRIAELVARQSVIPKLVIVRDINFEDYADVDEAGCMEEKGLITVFDKATLPAEDHVHYEHGHFFTGERSGVEPKTTTGETSDAATRRQALLKRLARRRYEEFQCERFVLVGRGNHPAFRNGHHYELSAHYRGSWNGQLYRLTRVRHRGWATTLYNEARTAPPYENEFEAIPSTIQFRPKRTTPVPKAPGVMTARIEASEVARTAAEDASSPFAADIDAEGRYVVRLPFDRRPDTTSQEGTGSRRVRMAQPYAGPDHGLHFPNPPAAEMLLGFLDGDVDKLVGLSALPDPWNHSPVPNEALSTRTQNAAEETPLVAPSPIMFGDTKNVIRSRVGHQFIMDDGNAGENVGITLETGNKVSSSGIRPLNLYWNSRIDMGGYRQRDFFEQHLGNISHVWNWAKFFREPSVPEFMGIALTEMATMLSFGPSPEDWAGETFGNTTRVGIEMNTDESIKLMGQNGVEIVMPNVFGFWGGGTVPGMDTQGSHRLGWAITDFLISALYEDAIKATVDKVKDGRKAAEGKVGTAARSARAAEWIKHEEYKQKKRLQLVGNIVKSALGAPSLDLKSAGDVQVMAFDTTKIGGGHGGIEVVSNADVTQMAGLDYTVEAAQGISLKAKGEPVGRPGILNAIPKMFSELGVPAPPGVKVNPGGSIMPEPTDCKIEIENENEDVQIIAGGKDDGARKKKISLLSRHGDIEQIAGSTVRVQIATWDEKKGEYKYEHDHPFFELRKGELILKCGSSAIKLEADGTITLQGKKVQIASKETSLVSTKDITLRSMQGKVNLSVDSPSGPPPDDSGIKQASMDYADAAGKQTGVEAALRKYNAEFDKYETQVFMQKQPSSSVEVSATDVKVTGKMGIKMDCVNFESEAKMKQELKGNMLTIDGKMTDVKGQMTIVKGSLIKIGS
ncbi:MAG: type VI secretion system tip protein VgrG [Rhodothermales bacterium]